MTRVERLVLAGTTPDERTMIAATVWSSAKQAVHFATNGADRQSADADRLEVLRLYRQLRREARADG
jgi:hypothetical protein